jgi:hypothetical protein
VNEMSSEAGQVSRPVAVMPTLTEALAAAAIPGQQLSLQHSLASLASLRSGFTPMMPQQAPPSYPEIALFSQFGQLFPGTTQIAQQQKHWNAETNNRGGRTKSGDTKSSSAYASRHQAAEQKRRNRINDRCAEIFIL